MEMDAGTPSGVISFHHAISGPKYFPVVLACPAVEGRRSSLRSGPRVNDRSRTVRFRDNPSVRLVEVSEDTHWKPTPSWSQPPEVVWDKDDTEVDDVWRETSAKSYAAARSSGLEMGSMVESPARAPYDNLEETIVWVSGEPFVY